jgi:hypothetical protein
MKRALLLMVFGACTVDGGPGPMTGDDTPIPDSRYCEQTYKLQGTFTPGMPVRDAETPEGCWPVGNWVFTVTLDPVGEIGDYNHDGKADRCGDVKETVSPTVATTYSFRVDRTDDGSGWVDNYTYTGSHMMQEMRIEVSGDGGGECEGDLLLAEGDREFNFKAQQTGTSITGFGEYKEGVRPGTK